MDIMETGKVPNDDQTSQLRYRAEQIAGSLAEHNQTLPEESIRRQLHELQVSQIELEMQNEELSELQRAQHEIRGLLARYTELYDFAPIGYFTIDCYGAIREVNLTGASLLGQDRTRLFCKRFTNYLAPTSRLPFMKFLHRVFTENTKLSCELMLKIPDRQPLHVQIDANVNTSSQTCHVIMQDITERKQAEESRKLASLVYQNSSEAMAVISAEGTFLSVNPAFTGLTGYAQSDVLGASFGLLRSELDIHPVYDLLLRSTDASGHWQGEVWVRRICGEARICQMNISAIVNDDHAVQRYVALFSDITRRKQSEELIWKQANFDSLTGLPNRNMFLDHLEQEIRKSQRSGLPLALMFLDLDHFKDINDTLGHATGDLLLKEAAQRLRSCIRSTDTVARLGGDEFTVLMSELDNRDAVERAVEDILCRLAEPYHIGDNVFYVSASIGVTLYPDDATNKESLLKSADQAMYAAKSQGRNCFHYFTPAMQDAAQARMHLIHDLRHAVAKEQFQLLYQPIVDMSTGVIRKAEALIRWHHPRHGLIDPARFIPVAEDTGIIIDIGNWVFREAATRAAQWRAAHDNAFLISVNMSPAQFLSSTHYTSSLASGGLSVEITEGMLLDASTEVIHRLIALRDAGVPVSLDDFGTGYSSLSYLKKFDIDYIKIDRSFVCNLTPDSDDLALCEAIIVMAHKLGLKVISEGIETEQQRQLLTQAGCDFGQGFLFSHAVPAEDFEQLLLAGPLNRQTAVKQL